MASTPYERGYEAGQWTEEEIVQVGGDEMTPEEFLAFQQAQTDETVDLYGDTAYMQGYVAGERDSLSSR